MSPSPDKNRRRSTSKKGSFIAPNFGAGASFIEGAPMAPETEEQKQ